MSIAGKYIDAPISMEVTNKSDFAADDFRLLIALAGTKIGISFFDALAKDTQVQISVGNQAVQVGAAVPFLVGQIDDIDLDVTNQTVELTGRDLSARFIDNKTSENFLQQTSSQVVQTLAERRGLQANVKATTEKVGTFYELQNAHLSVDHTEWDLMVELAKHEDFDLWVSNQTVNFQPRLDPSSKSYVLNYVNTAPAPKLLGLGPSSPGQLQANFCDLKVKRAMTLASNVTVNVMSYNQVQQQSVKGTWTIKKDTSANAAAPQVYNYRFANLTQAAAQKQAQAIAEDISRYERRLTAKLPGDNILTTRMMVSLSGTRSKFDQLYYPESVTRRLTQGGGYEMEVTAKNHSTPVSTGAT